MTRNAFTGSMGELFFTDKELEAARHLLYEYGRSNGYAPGDFTKRLIQAMNHADHQNLATLLTAFPEFKRPVDVLRQDGVGALSNLTEASTSYRAEQARKDQA